MSKKDKNKTPDTAETTEAAVQDPPVQEEEKADALEKQLSDALAQVESSALALREKEDQFLRLCAEYDNYRKRSQREKESAWQDARCDTVAAFLPVYDDLERALKQETADEAFKKGVEMTMSEFRKILSALGVEEIPALGAVFDPNLHNAVMHVEEDGVAESTIVDVFQSGFRQGEKIVRFAMVKVAN